MRFLLMVSLSWMLVALSASANDVKQWEQLDCRERIAVTGNQIKQTEESYARGHITRTWVSVAQVVHFEALLECKKISPKKFCNASIPVGEQMMVDAKADLDAGKLSAQHYEYLRQWKNVTINQRCL